MAHRNARFYFSVLDRGDWLIAALLVCAATSLAQPASDTDSYEPNNDAESARPLPLETPFTIELDGGDEDWFALGVNEPGVLILHFQQTDAANKPSVQFSHADGRSVPARPVKREDLATAVPVSDGRYLVRFTRGRSPHQSFALEARFLENFSARAGNLFVIGMSLTEDQLKQVEYFASTGGGRVIEVDSSTSNLSLALANIREVSEGSAFDTGDVIKSMIDRVFEEMLVIPEQAYTRAWLAENLQLSRQQILPGLSNDRPDFTSTSLAEQLGAIQQQAMATPADQKFEHDHLAREIGRIVLMPMDSIQ